MSFLPSGSEAATVAVTAPVTGLASVSASVKSLSPIIGGRFGGAAVAASGWLVAWTVAMGQGRRADGPELTPRSGGQHPQRRRRRRGERTRARKRRQHRGQHAGERRRRRFRRGRLGDQDRFCCNKIRCWPSECRGCRTTLADDVSAGGAVGLRDAACRDATGADAVDVSADEGVTEDFDFADRFGRDSLASLDV